MECSTSRSNVLLISLGLLLLSSLGLCTNRENQNIKKYNLSPNSNHQWRHGTLLIGHKTKHDAKSKEATGIDLDYQSDMVWEMPVQKMEQNGFPVHNNAAVERLLQMNPTVECSGSHMRLQVKDADSKPGALLFVDRGDLPPLSLSKLPKSCGYKIGSTRRDFVMVAPYDACFVLVTESCFVLPLRWFGLPVQMACPVSVPTEPSPITPMVTCLPGKMVISNWTTPPGLKVNLKSKWEPITQVWAKCNVDVRHSPFKIIFPYESPCVEKKDGKYIVKLSGEADVEVSCPAVAQTGSRELMMDFGQNPSPTLTQSIKTPVLEHDMPPTPSVTIDHFPWYDHKTAPPVDFPLYPNYPEGRIPDVGHYSYMFQPGQPPKPGSPSLDMHPLRDPLWYWSEPHPQPPFYYPSKPEQPKVSPQPTTPLKPASSPTYPCPFYHTTEKPEVKTTASPPVTVSKHYQPFSPYYPGYRFPYLPHSTTPTPFTQKPQDPAISRPGTAVVFPKHPQPEILQPFECFQYCQVGVLDCCPQIAFHQHYYFVPQEQNGKLHYPFIPLPGLPTWSRPDSFHAQSQPPQEAPATPSHPTFTNAPVSPQLYPIKGQQGTLTYLTNPGNKPREQTDSSSAYFNHNAYFHWDPSTFDMNQWIPQIHPESSSTESPVTKAAVTPQLYPVRGQHGQLTYHQPQEGNPAALPGHHNAYFHWDPSTFDMNQWNPQVQPEGHLASPPAHNFYPPDHSSNIYVPYDEQSSHQSDGPPSNTQSPNILSITPRYESQSANRAKVDATEPALIFGSRQNPQFAHYETLLEQPTSKHQPSDALKTAKGYVLLQQGPPDKRNGDTLPPPPYSPVVMHQNFPSNFLNEPQNLRVESEGLDNAGQTAGDKSRSLLQSASAEPNPAHFSLDSVRGRYLKYPLRHFSRGPNHRTLQ